MSEQIGLVVEVHNGPGVLHELTGVIFRHGGDITSVAILDSEKALASVFFEVGGGVDVAALEKEMRGLDIVAKVGHTDTLNDSFPAGSEVALEIA